MKTLLTLYFSFILLISFTVSAEISTVSIKNEVTWTINDSHQLTIPALDETHQLHLKELNGGKDIYVTLNQGDKKQYAYSLLPLKGMTLTIPPSKQSSTLHIDFFTTAHIDKKLSIKLLDVSDQTDTEIQAQHAFELAIHAVMSKFLNNNYQAKDIIELFIKAENTLDDAGLIDLARQCDYSLGTWYRSIDQLDLSITHYRKAIAYFKTSGQLELVNLSKNRLGLSYWNQQKLDLALSTFLETLDSVNRLNQTRLIQILYNNIALVYRDKGDLSEAENYFLQVFKELKFDIFKEREVEFQAALSMHTKSDSLSNSIGNLALIYMSTGQLSRAEFLLKQRIAFEDKTNGQQNKVSSQMNLASLYMKSNQFDLALPLLNQSLEAFEQLDSKWWISLTHYNLAITYKDLGLDQMARTHFEQSLELRSAENNPKGRINSLFELAILNNNNTYLEEAEQLATLHKKNITLSKIAEHRAREAAKEKIYTKAQQHINDAKQFIENKHYYRKQLELAILSAQLYQETQQHDMAISTLKHVLKIKHLSIDRQNLNKALNTLAFSYFKTGQLPLAKNTIEQALTETTQLLQFTSHSKTRQQLSLHLEASLSLYAMIATEDNDSINALNRVTQELKQWQSSPATDHPDKAKAQQLYSDIEQVSFALENSRLNDSSRKQLQQKLASLSNKLDYLKTVAQPTSLDFDIKTIQQDLPIGDVLIQYLIGEYGGTMWWISKDLIICESLPTLPELLNLSQKAQSTLAGKSRDVQTVKQLSELILAPLTSFPNAKKLTFVLDQPLNLLPLSAMLKPNSNNNLISEYLIKRQTSLIGIDNAITSKSENEQPYHTLIVSNPVHHPNDPRVQALDVNSNIMAFAPLSGTANEAKKIAQWTEAESLSGFDANRDEWKKHANHTPQLHMATHAFFNETQPDLSALVLSAYDESGKQVPSMLRASEIRNMNLSYELVVLSGCETGLTSGNGLQGLTQSFLQAGTKKLIGSLWQVDDHITSQMMTIFYQNRHHGQSIELALNNAKKKIMSQVRTRHPKFWSGWFLISQ